MEVPKSLWFCLSGTNNQNPRHCRFYVCENGVCYFRRKGEVYGKAIKCDAIEYSLIAKKDIDIIKMLLVGIEDNINFPDICIDYINKARNLLGVDSNENG